jgi:hypothetical protein
MESGFRIHKTSSFFGNATTLTMYLLGCFPLDKPANQWYQGNDTQFAMIFNICWFSVTCSDINKICNLKELKVLLYL